MPANSRLVRDAYNSALRASFRRATTGTLERTPMAANDSDDKRRALIREGMAARLRSLEIGRKATKARFGEQPARPSCSFCSSREEEVFMLVPGLDGAFVCDDCVEMLAEELKYAKGG